MKLRKNQYNRAYIDGANLHKGVESLGWKLDYRRFRIWLSDKYGVESAYIFLGLIPKYKDLYSFLQQCGYILIFKEVIYDGDGKAKGNCDADLVLQATRDAYEKTEGFSILVSSDGDYAGLVKFLLDRKQFHAILSPHTEALCSILLKRTGARIAYLKDQQSILEVK